MKTLTCIEKPDFPSYLDSTMLGSYKACPAKYMINYLLGYVPSSKSIHLHAGGVYAHGLELARMAIWHKKMPLDEAIYYARIGMIQQWGDYDAPEGTNKTLENLLLAIEEYFTHYGTLEDPIQPHLLASGKPAVEFSFAIPIPNTRHPITGEPIIYSGRFDMLGEYQGTLFAVDEKTTTQLGAQWSRQWDLRSQFTGYCWAAQQYGYPVGGAVVRGISILKRDFGHAQVITYRPPHMVASWLQTTQTIIASMIQDWQQDEWLQDFDSACTAYSGCPYQILCDKKTPNRWVETNFILDKWDPLAHSHD